MARVTAVRPANVVRSNACGCVLSYSHCGKTAGTGHSPKHVAFRDVERAVLGGAEPPCRVAHLVQDGLEVGRAHDCAEHAADRFLLIP